jgi:hypothetical protein
VACSPDDQIRIMGGVRSDLERRAVEPCAWFVNKMPCACRVTGLGDLRCGEGGGKEELDSGLERKEGYKPPGDGEGSRQMSSRFAIFAAPRHCQVQSSSSAL